MAWRSAAAARRSAAISLPRRKKVSSFSVSASMLAANRFKRASRAWVWFAIRPTVPAYLTGGALLSGGAVIRAVPPRRPGPANRARGDLESRRLSASTGDVCPLEHDGYAVGRFRSGAPDGVR